MKKILFLFILIGFVFSSLSWAGSGDLVIEEKPITGKLEVGSGTLEIPNSISLPGTCSVGDIYMDTDATSGQRCYLCESANTWVLQGDGGGDTITEGDSNVEVIDAGTGEIDFDVDGTKRADIKSGGLYLSTGARINEFSTDGTFAGNSDIAVPTEKAIQTYGDANWGIAGDKIIEGDTSVEVVDTGDGYIVFTEDGAEIGRFAGGGFTVYNFLSLAENANYGYAFLTNYATDDSYAEIIAFRKSASDTIGTKAETASSETLGYINAFGVNSSSDFATASQIQFKQNGVSGATYVPGKIEFWAGTNAAAVSKRADITPSGLALESGTSINEFSTDGTFAGNSDIAVPTEKAIQTYGDANWGIAGDKIIEGDTYVEVVDTGDGYIRFVEDGGAVGEFKNGNFCIGTTNSISKLTLEGALAIDEVTAPSATAGYGKVYVKATDSLLYFKDDGGTEYDLTDDVPDAGDFGAATDLDANGALNTGCVDANELVSTAVTPGSYTNTNLTVDADGRISAATNGSGGSGIVETLMASELNDPTEPHLLVTTELHNTILSNVQSVSWSDEWDFPARSEGWNFIFIKEAISQNVTLDPYSTENWFFRSNDLPYAMKGAGVPIVNTTTGRSTIACFSTQTAVYCTGDAGWE